MWSITSFSGTLFPNADERVVFTKEWFVWKPSILTLVHIPQTTFLNVFFPHQRTHKPYLIMYTELLFGWQIETAALVYIFWALTCIFIIQANYTPFQFWNVLVLFNHFLINLWCSRPPPKFFSPNDVYLSQQLSSSSPSITSSCANIKFLCSSPLQEQSTFQTNIWIWSLACNKMWQTAWKSDEKAVSGKLYQV